MKRRDLATLIICGGIALALTACSGTFSAGTAGVRGLHRTSSATPSSPPKVAGTSTGQSSGSGSGSSTNAPAVSQSLNEVGAQLSTLDAEIDSVDSDLSNPQGDS